MLSTCKVLGMITVLNGILTTTSGIPYNFIINLIYLLLSHISKLQNTVK
jgi:hypothetical protein